MGYAIGDQSKVRIPRFCQAMPRVRPACERGACSWEHDPTAVGPPLVFRRGLAVWGVRGSSAGLPSTNTKPVLRNAQSVLSATHRTPAVGVGCSRALAIDGRAGTLPMAMVVRFSAVVRAYLAAAIPGGASGIVATYERESAAVLVGEGLAQAILRFAQTLVNTLNRLPAVAR